MSAIAGIVHFDGRPVVPGDVEGMTAAMGGRGPDGIQHWRRANVALGQCMLRTTPESLEETQPLGNEDESRMLAMDGRVDNWEDLRRELLGKGAHLRTRADAELVLRAYEVWGEACPDHIIGEYVFFVWDARRQRLFAARDAAGARHFYYCRGNGWFAFSSEIKGLLALPQVERRLNESRLLDYLVEEFDRDDETGTFYQDILRLPAGHAMDVSARGQKIWRWWSPGELSERRFGSLQECTEAFMDQLRVAVKCRLRSIKPVGAMLSGGLDSSTLVGLISRELRGELKAPLRTFSLIREDRENCPDWCGIHEILKADPWLRPEILTPAKVDEVWQSEFSGISRADEPFALANGLNYGLIYEAGRAAGCGVVLDGMAGDVLFYDPRTTTEILAQRRHFTALPALLAAFRSHGFPSGLKYAMRTLAASFAPNAARAFVRRRRDERLLSEGDMKVLKRTVARDYQATKRSPLYLAGGRPREENDQIAHARNFTTGLISFGHEVYGPLALDRGVEPRSPFSDRRMIEFAIQMPLDAKLAIPWYKHVLRSGTEGMLPEAVRWRQDIGGHPGWAFFDRLAKRFASGTSGVWDPVSCSKALDKWVSRAETEACWDRYLRQGDSFSGGQALRLVVLSQWLESGPLGWRR